MRNPQEFVAHCRAAVWADVYESSAKPSFRSEMAGLRQLAVSVNSHYGHSAPKAAQ